MAEPNDGHSSVCPCGWCVLKRGNGEAARRNRAEARHDWPIEKVKLADLDKAVIMRGIKNQQQERQHMQYALTLFAREGWLWAAIDGCECAACVPARGNGATAEERHRIGKDWMAQLPKPVSWRAIIGCNCPPCTTARNAAVQQALQLPPSRATPTRLLPPAAPVTEERDLTCTTCRRFYCRIVAPIDACITVVCEGCKLEGR